jgi:glutamyl-tRNA reductase
MAGLAAEALRARRAGPIHVVNRTLARAASLAARVDGRPFGLDRLGQVLRDVEVAMLCTAATDAVVTEAHARAAVTARAAGRLPALFLIDLAVPRNAAPGVRAVDGVAVADIDDLRDRLRGEGPGAPVADLERARAIIGEETRRFEDRRDAARLAPLIRALHASGERAVAAELRRAGPRLSRLEPEEREAVEALARGLVAKLLHTPTVRVKELTGRGKGDAAAQALADLFGVEYPPGV